MRLYAYICPSVGICNPPAISGFEIACHYKSHTPNLFDSDWVLYSLHMVLICRSVSHSVSSGNWLSKVLILLIFCQTEDVLCFDFGNSEKNTALVASISAPFSKYAFNRHSDSASV